MEYFVSGIGSKLLYQFICDKLRINITTQISSFRLIHTHCMTEEMILFKLKYDKYVIEVLSKIIVIFLYNGGSLYLSGIFKEYFLEYY